METVRHGLSTGRRVPPPANPPAALSRRLLIFALPALILVMSAVIPTDAVRGAGPAAPKPGAWTQLGSAQGQSIPTLVHVANGNDLVIWMAPVTKSHKYYYVAAQLKPKGGMVSKPADIFGGKDWTGLDPFTAPVLVSQGSKPLLVFQGSRSTSGSDQYSNGCIVGDLLTAGGWQLQGWSLSAACDPTSHFGATITKNGTLSAAWPGGWSNGNGVRYRIGVSSSIPATPDDKHISTAPGQAGQVAEATDAATQDIYAAWARFSSAQASKDGIWAANLSKSSTPLHAPGSGTSTFGAMRQPVAVASPTGRGEIYLAYCNDASPCNKVEFWRYGAKSASTMPKSTTATQVSISAGPAGRLWIAWWSASTGTVSVVRTNKEGSALGPVITHPGPRGCNGDANATIKISSGTQQHLDVVMICYSGATHAFATQSLVPLQLSATTTAINHKQGGSVTYRVSDAGDWIQGATVKVGGKKGKTNGNGQVTFTFPRGAKTGSFKVIAILPNYLQASMRLQVT
ncbi:MAG TPA: hypothetical protein VFA78_07235 [Chloroflexota bacterium]|nr:hypothetical protein [Chloroflexota bacterium]